MTRLEPLSQSSKEPRVRALLQAGRSDMPPARFRGQLLASMGVASALASTVTTAAAASGQLGAAGAGALPTNLSLLVLKWVGVGMLAGGALAGAADRMVAPPVPPESAHDSKPHVEQRSRPEPPRRLAAPPAPSVVLDVGEPLAPEPHSRASTPAAPQPADLGREVAAIDAVRRALAQGELGLARRELDRYGALGGEHTLEREARVLRIELLRRTGDAAAADRLVQQYLRQFPNDAHGSRLRVKP